MTMQPRRPQAVLDVLDVLDATPVGYLAALARTGDTRARAYFAHHPVSPEEVACECDLDARAYLRAIRTAQNRRRHDA